MSNEAYRALTSPEALLSRTDVLSRTSPVPATAGVYAWYFGELPGAVDAASCARFDGKALLYVGIAPQAPPANGGKPSKQHLRRRIRTHFAGNASASTLRMTLGVLLGLPLRRRPSGRLSFGTDEATLNDWMTAHASVTYFETATPWADERELLTLLDLPLNLKGNGHHRFSTQLKHLRKEARRAAIALER